METGSYPPPEGRPTTEELRPKDLDLIPARSASGEKESVNDYFDSGKWQHLLSQLWRHGWKAEGRGAITWAWVMRMRNIYGSRVVDSALSDACLNPESPVFSSARYFQSICERYKATFA